MALTLEQQQTFDKLDEAARLYERYLEIARIGQISATSPEETEPTPPPTNAPLTLVLHPAQ